jgi:predicted Fe-S protein YdhL (DUF1289 family)
MTGYRPRAASPCTRLCTLDAEGSRCLGCWRTLDEIAGWPDMSDVEREAVWRQLDARRRAGVGEADRSRRAHDQPGERTDAPDPP